MIGAAFLEVLYLHFLKWKKETWIQLGALLALVAFLTVIHVTNPGFFSQLWRVVAGGNMEETTAYIASFGVWAVAVSFIIDVLINAVGFLPSIFISTANGVLFGVTTGIVVSWLAETVGVILSFLFMRGILRSSAEQIIAKSNALQRLDEFSGKNGFKMMLLARTLPYFPSGLLTALGAVSSISVRDYAIANLIGKFPSTALEVVIGHDIINYEKNMGRLTIVVLAATGVYLALWYIQKRKKQA